MSYPTMLHSALARKVSKKHLNEEIPIRTSKAMPEQKYNSARVLMRNLKSPTSITSSSSWSKFGSTYQYHEFTVHLGQAIPGPMYLQNGWKLNVWCAIRLIPSKGMPVMLV
jgi:hypothetical protein